MRRAQTRTLDGGAEAADSCRASVRPAPLVDRWITHCFADVATKLRLVSHQDACAAAKPPGKRRYGSVVVPECAECGTYTHGSQKFRVSEPGVVTISELDRDGAKRKGEVVTYGVDDVHRNVIFHRLECIFQTQI